MRTIRPFAIKSYELKTTRLKLLDYVIKKNVPKEILMSGYFDLIYTRILPDTIEENIYHNTYYELNIIKNNEENKIINHTLLSKILNQVLQTTNRYFIKNEVFSNSIKDYNANTLNNKEAGLQFTELSGEIQDSIIQNTIYNLKSTGIYNKQKNPSNATVQQSLTDLIYSNKNTNINSVEEKIQLSKLLYSISKGENLSLNQRITASELHNTTSEYEYTYTLNDLINSQNINTYKSISSGKLSTYSRSNFFNTELTNSIFKIENKNIKFFDKYNVKIVKQKADIYKEYKYFLNNEIKNLEDLSDDTNYLYNDKSFNDLRIFTDEALVIAKNIKSRLERTTFTGIEELMLDDYKKILSFISDNYDSYIKANEIINKIDQNKSNSYNKFNLFFNGELRNYIDTGYDSYADITQISDTGYEQYIKYIQDKINIMKDTKYNYKSGNIFSASDRSIYYSGTIRRNNIIDLVVDSIDDYINLIYTSQNQTNDSNSYKRKYENKDFAANQIINDLQQIVYKLTDSEHVLNERIAYKYITDAIHMLSASEEAYDKAVNSIESAKSNKSKEYREYVESLNFRKRKDILQNLKNVYEQVIKSNKNIFTNGYIDRHYNYDKSYNNLNFSKSFNNTNRYQYINSLTDFISRNSDKYINISNYENDFVNSFTNSITNNLIDKFSSNLINKKTNGIGINPGTVLSIYNQYENMSLLNNSVLYNVSKYYGNSILGSRANQNGYNNLGNTSYNDFFNYNLSQRNLIYNKYFNNITANSGNSGNQSNRNDSHSGNQSNRNDSHSNNHTDSYSNNKNNSYNNHNDSFSSNDYIQANDYSLSNNYKIKDISNNINQYFKKYFEYPSTSNYTSYNNLYNFSLYNTVNKFSEFKNDYISYMSSFLTGSRMHSSRDLFGEQLNKTDNFNYQRVGLINNIEANYKFINTKVSNLINHSNYNNNRKVNRNSSWIESISRNIIYQNGLNQNTVHANIDYTDLYSVLSNKYKPENSIRTTRFIEKNISTLKEKFVFTNNTVNLADKSDNSLQLINKKYNTQNNISHDISNINDSYNTSGYTDMIYKRENNQYNQSIEKINSNQINIENNLNKKIEDLKNIINNNQVNIKKIGETVYSNIKKDLKLERQRKGHI